LCIVVAAVVARVAAAVLLVLLLYFTCSLVVIWQRPLFSVQHEGRWCRQRCSLRLGNARKGEVKEPERDGAENVEL